MTALGVLCCFALFVCLTLLASFFLPSHLSLKHVRIYRKSTDCSCTLFGTAIVHINWFSKHAVHMGNFESHPIHQLIQMRNVDIFFGLTFFPLPGIVLHACQKSSSQQASNNCR